MLSLTLSGAPDSAGGPQVISTLWAALFGGFTHALENIDIQESFRYGLPRLETLPSARVRSFLRPYLIWPQGSPGVLPCPPAVLVVLRMKPELLSFLLSVFSGLRVPLTTPAKTNYRKPSLTVPPAPPPPFSALQHLFCSLSGVCISIST